MSHTRTGAKYPCVMPGGSPERRVAVQGCPARSAVQPGLLTALLTALSAVLLTVLWAAPSAEALVGQDPAPDPTSEPAPGTEVPAGQVPDATTTTVEVLAPAAGSTEQSESEKAGGRVQLVVIALIVLAVVVAAVTAVFWRRTRPSRLASAEAAVVVGHTPKS